MGKVFNALKRADEAKDVERAEAGPVEVEHHHAQEYHKFFAQICSFNKYAVNRVDIDGTHKKCRICIKTVCFEIFSEDGSQFSSFAYTNLEIQLYCRWNYIFQ